MQTAFRHGFPNGDILQFRRYYIVGVLLECGQISVFADLDRSDDLRIPVCLERVNVIIRKETVMVYTMVRASLLVTALGFIMVTAAVAQKDIRTERVQFKKGANSAVVEDSITGYATVDYVLGAGKGQHMNVSMATDNTSNYFNILGPGESDVAFFNGSMDENQYEGILSASGDYKVRVYLMRSAARRNEVANYRLEMIITDAEDKSSASADSSAGGDALVEGTDYNATGSIPCAMAPGQPTGSCPFGVTREGKGNGIVTVTRPDGRTRAIFFENGKAVGYDFNQADPGEFRASHEADLTVVHIGNERYEIPDAVIFGG